MDIQEPPIIKHGLRNVIVTGVAFMLCFVAFNPIQGLQVTLHGNEGFIALGILTAAVSLFNIFTAGIAVQLGQKWAMVLGFVTLPIWMAAQLVLQIPATAAALSPAVTQALLYGTSALLGCGTALWYTSQGSFVSLQAPPKSLGTYNALFFAVFMVNYVIGGVLLHFVNSEDKTILMVVMGCVSVAAVICLLFLHQPREDIRRAKAGQRFDLLAMLRMFAEGRMLLLTPLVLYKGISGSYRFGAFAKPANSFNVFGLCLVTYGLTQIAGNLSAGKISDRVGRLPVLFGASAFSIGGYLASHWAGEARIYLFYVSYGLLGVGEGAMDVVLYACMGTFFRHKSQGAFAFYRMALGAGGALMFGISPLLIAAHSHPLLYSEVLCASLLLFGMALALLLHKCVEPLDGARGHAYQVLDTPTSLSNIADTDFQ